MRQNNGVNDEDTTGFEDDLEALEAELNMREATRKEKQPGKGKTGVTRESRVREGYEIQTLGNEPDAMETIVDIERQEKEGEMCQENEGEMANEAVMEKDSAEA